MTALTANLVLQTLILATGADTYPEAYQVSVDSGRPLLVLVGADWCPACQTMKHATLAKMEKHGKLKQVSFSVLNTDHEPGTARQIMRGTSIPQLVLYEKTAGGWKRSQITGAASEREVELLISRAVEQQTRLARRKSSDTPAERKASGGGQ